MGLYTKIDRQLDKSYEIVFINKSLWKQNFYLKIVVLRNLIFLCSWVKGFFNPFINLSFFSSLDILLKISLFISSKILSTAFPFLFSKNDTLLSFTSNPLFISAIVSPISFVVCLKSVLWIKALRPIFDCVLCSSLLNYSMIWDESSSTLGSFLINSIKNNNLSYYEKTCSIRFLPSMWKLFGYPPFLTLFFFFLFVMDFDFSCLERFSFVVVGFCLGVLLL